MKIILVLLGLAASFLAQAQEAPLATLFELRSSQEINDYFKTHFEVSEADSVQIRELYYGEINEFVTTHNKEAKAQLIEFVKLINDNGFKVSDLVFEEGKLEVSNREILSLEQLYKHNDLQLMIDVYIENGVGYDDWRCFSSLEFKLSPLQDKHKERGFIPVTIDTSGYYASIQSFINMVKEEDKVKFYKKLLVKEDLDQLPEDHPYRRKIEHLLKRLPNEAASAWRTIKAINSYNLTQNTHYKYEWVRADNLDVMVANLNFMRKIDYNYTVLLHIVAIEFNGDFKISSFEN